MTLIADVFRKLQTTKDDVRQMSKKSRLRRLFNKRNGERSETLLPDSTFILFIGHCKDN